MSSAHISPLVSSDLIWEIAGHQNSYLVKRRSGGGAQFSRDPMNLANKNSRKHAGFANEKAFGIQPGPKGEMVLTSKKSKHHNRPVSNTGETSFGSGRSGRKVYKSIVSSTAKSGYRPDLRKDAVARASALRKSGGTKKETPARKERGAKARKAAAEGS